LTRSIFQVQPSAFVYARTLRGSAVPRKHLRSGSQLGRTQDIPIPSRLQFGHHCTNHVESDHQFSTFRFRAVQVSVERKIGKQRFGIVKSVVLLLLCRRYPNEIFSQRLIQNLCQFSSQIYFDIVPNFIIDI